MISNASHLLYKAPIVDMVPSKVTGPGGTSYGLGEAGYDIRIKQEVRFLASGGPGGRRWVYIPTYDDHGQMTAFTEERGRFSLASAMEEFNMPNDLVGIVHDKSTWARKGLSVFNTVIEPGWKGFLTLELVYNGEDDLIIPAGSGIAQVIFHQTIQTAQYDGKYQNQPDQPVAAIESI